MKSCVELLFVSLLTLCEAQGTIVTPVFVLKGRDLLLKLHADPPEKFLLVDWKINETVTLVTIDHSGQSKVHDNFTGRLEFEKFSVRLKNVQEVDSGLYSAVAVTGVNKLLTEYKVTVQGPVSPVELIVDGVDNSSASCDLHVTCRTHNAHISSTFRCVDRFCSQEGGERPEVTTSGASLQIYLLNSTIICNHSNQVHWIQDFNTAEQHCYPSTDPLLVWVIVSCTAALTLILIVVLSVWLCIDRRRRICSRRSIDNVIYEAAQDETSAPQNPTNDVTYSSDETSAPQNPTNDVTYSSDETSAPQNPTNDVTYSSDETSAPQNPTNDVTYSSDETSAPQNPTNDVTYSSVKFHARSPQAAAATRRNQSESLYAEVKKPGRSFND
uniref:uncharacterized protein LOC120814897 n=1 Tax=Gasterosteus aculeatus aculeatus TaxID=481459 RepID=UPI001A987175|nr:uncharacterized protein LOC120814897 [Gasterosteus aculeatus aculeatus]